MNDLLDRKKMKGKVLIVDDDSIVGGLLETWLSDANFQVEYFNNGQAALDRMDQIDPDIIISDVVMPVMDGYEFHQQLRHSPETAGIPFVFLSSQSELSDQLRGLRMGADDYLCKPFDKEDLLKCLERVMERAAKARSFHSQADFSGNLAQTKLNDIIQITEMNSKSGELLIKSTKDQKIGRIFFTDGRVINAQMGPLNGEEAFYGLMDQDVGYFEFYSRSVTVPEQISADNMALLLKGSRLVDESGNLTRKMPNPDVLLCVRNRQIPPSIVQRAGKAEGLNFVNSILSMIDEEQTLREILDCVHLRSDMSRPRAASILADLISAEVVAIQEEDPESDTIGSLARPGVEKRLVRLLKDFEDHKMTGLLELRGRQTKSAIYLDEGRIVHAAHGKVKAKKALFRIFSERGGSFEFQPQPEVPNHTIRESLDRLIEEGRKEAQVFRKLKKDLLYNGVTVNTQKSKEASIIRNIPNMEYILSLAEQYGRLREIIDASRLTDLQTYNYLSYMDKMGVVTIAPREPAESFQRTSYPF
ncbi:MAG: hypothetical protein DRI57_05895 [Deltaproteobacteria bacterium]|nr:MAG: hypothetical protein DRI57_05895 [Deltaproteobacteria bacterium]